MLKPLDPEPPDVTPKTLKAVNFPMLSEREIPSPKYSDAMATIVPARLVRGQGRALGYGYGAVWPLIFIIGTLRGVGGLNAHSKD